MTTSDRIHSANRTWPLLRTLTPVIVVLLFVGAAVLVYRLHGKSQERSIEVRFQRQTASLQIVENQVEDRLLHWHTLLDSFCQRKFNPTEEESLRWPQSADTNSTAMTGGPLKFIRFQTTHAGGAGRVFTANISHLPVPVDRWWKDHGNAYLSGISTKPELTSGQCYIELLDLRNQLATDSAHALMIVFAASSQRSQLESKIDVMLLPADAMLALLHAGSDQRFALHLNGGTLTSPNYPVWLDQCVKRLIASDSVFATVDDKDQPGSDIRIDLQSIYIGPTSPIWLSMATVDDRPSAGLTDWKEAVLRLAPGGLVASGLLLALYLVGLRRRQAKTEQLLREHASSRLQFERSEHRLRSIFENIDLMAVVLSPTGEILFCNECTAATTGYERDRLIGANWFDLFGRESLPRSPFLRIHHVERESERHSENVIRDTHGLEHTIHWSHTFGRNPDGTIDNITSLGLDITETRRTRRELQRLTLAIEQSPMSVVITDPEGRIEWVSSGFTRLSGYSLDEARGQNPRILNSGLMSKQVYSDLWRTIKAGRTWRGELLNRNKYGTLYWESVTITPVMDSSGRITDFLGVKQDISERIAAEQEMKKLSAAIFQSVNSIAVLDTNGLIEYVNPKFCDSTSKSVTELIGRNIDLLLPQQTNLGPFAGVVEEIRRNKVWRANFPVDHPSGQQIWMRCSISPITHDDRLLSYLLVGEDISHEMETLGKLTESEKMAAVGMLAAGVSHEFKNLLGGIMGNASYALEELDANSTNSLEIARDTLSQVIEISERANQVAMSLLTYSKTKTADLSHQDLPQLIANTVSLIESEMRSRGIELVTYADQLPAAAIDAGRIQQVLLNLLINAEHAITGPGVITIAALLEGNWVRVRIGDTGCGIPKENISRIFDPFFSTKGVWGKDEVVGSGMGLAICRNVAREHGGDITVESRVGVGSTFTLSLPVTRSEVDGAKARVTGETQKQVVLFSLDHTIYSKYFPEACELGIELTAVDSIAFMDRELTMRTSLLVCDARFTGKVELFKVIEVCKLAGVPYVMINCGAMEYQLSHLYDHAKENFTDLPEFSRLLENSLRDHAQSKA